MVAPVDEPKTTTEQKRIVIRMKGLPSGALIPQVTNAIWSVSVGIATRVVNTTDTIMSRVKVNLPDVSSEAGLVTMGKPRVVEGTPLIRQGIRISISKTQITVVVLIEDRKITTAPKAL